MKPGIVASLTWMTLLSLSQAAFDPTPYAWTKPIRSPEGRDQEVVRVALDAEVWQNLADHRHDWRVVRGEAEAVPALLTPRTTEETRQVRRTVKSKTMRLEMGADNRIDITIRCLTNTPVHGLVMSTPLRDFERRVTVAVSDNDAQWRVIEEHSLVYDYSRFMDVRSTDLEFAPGVYPYIRLTIEDVTDETESPLRRISKTRRNGEIAEETDHRTVTQRPFRVDAIKLFTLDTVTRETRTAMQPCAISISERNDRESDSLINLETRGQPIRQLVIQTPERNFSRTVSLQVPVKRGATTEWRTIANGRLTRISFRRFQREQLFLEFPEMRAARLRLRIQNGESAPLAINAVQASGPIIDILFIQESPSPCRLLYGWPEARPPQLDTRVLRTLLDKGFAPVDASLGPQAANPGARAMPGWRTWLHSRIVFGVVAVLVLAALAAGLVKAGRQVDARPNDSDNG